MAETKAPEATYLGTRYITDGVHRGVVRITSVNRVHIVDLLTGRKHQLVPSQTRRMTPQEILEYSDTPAVDDPTPVEIARITAAFRAGWTAAQLVERSRPEHFFKFVQRALNGA